MKKQIVSGVVAVLLLLAVSGAARAESGTEVSVGLKTWMNEWNRDVQGGVSAKASSIWMVGPAVEVEFANHLFTEASYMVSASNYKFDVEGVTTEVDRKDIDLAVGYQINHKVGVFLGYRNSAFKEKDTDIKETVFGPLAGVRGAFPVNEKLSLVGKLTYLHTKLKIEEPELVSTDGAPGWIAEAGVKYAFAKHVAGVLGYKYETTKATKADGAEITDTFSGFTLDMTYTF